MYKGAYCVDLGESFQGGKKTSGRKHMKTLDKEHPKISLQASREKDNTKMKPRKEKKRKAQVVYPIPGDRQGRSEPG